MTGKRGYFVNKQSWDMKRILSERQDYLLNSVFGGFALGTNATNLLDLGSLLRLADRAASAAVGDFWGLATLSNVWKRLMTIIDDTRGIGVRIKMRNSSYFHRNNKS